MSMALDQRNISMSNILKELSFFSLSTILSADAFHIFFLQMWLIISSFIIKTQRTYLLYCSYQ